ncbi:putative F-box domain, LysM domain, F-box-like domain superfamily, LysM domain superfamily protein [Dioscorea sansibarensis]
MGCCGDGEDELFAPLLSPDPNPNPNSSSSRAVLSPLNSNFSALLSPDVLRSILERLPPADLARSACVCRLWRAVASERDVQEQVFRAPWGVRSVVGCPSSPAFWRHNGIGRFAISHRLQRGDTVPGLALKYSVQAMDIRRLNNMMSDHGIHSRDRLLIPISKPDLLLDTTCFIELDAYAKREAAVLYLEGGPDGKGGYLGRAITERGKQRILDSVKRSMQVDEGTAEYYLSISNGDPRAAILQFSEDLSWEQQRTSA